MTVQHREAVERRRGGQPPTVLWLSSLAAALAVLASTVGVFSHTGDGPQLVRSIRGEWVELYGFGPYTYDTVFMAEGSRGTDVVTLILAVPLLVVGLVAYRRRSLRGGLLVVGGLAYLLYVYASRSLYNAYNELFLVYVAVFAASLFALVVTVATFDLALLRTRLTPSMPRRGLAAFLLGCAVITSAVWLLPLLGSALSGEPPELLDTYSTSVTDVLDLGVIVPTLVMTAVLVLRCSVLGYVLAAAMIVLLVLTAGTIIVGTVMQLAAGVTFTTGEVVGPISGFLVLAVIGLVLLGRLLRAA